MLHEETPQYKIQNIGVNAITDVEVIAGIICNGDTPNAMKKASEISRKLLSDIPELTNIGRLSVTDLKEYMSLSQALRLTSAFEFARRKYLSPCYEKPRVTASRDVYNHIFTHLADLYHEEFWVVFLNKSNEIIGKKRLSVGGTAGTVADVKLIFKDAISKNGCAAIIVAHNHPSGNLKPSDADMQLTKKIREAGKIMDIPMLDHLIISDRGYFSFADKGMI